MNLNKLMKQAQKMQEQMAKTQAELEEKTVEVSVGGGKVTVSANGAGDVLSIKIDKEIVDPNDVAFLEAHDNLMQNRSNNPLARCGCRCRMRPREFQISPQLHEPFSFRVAQRGLLLALDRRKLICKVAHRQQRLVPAPFQLACDQAIVGIHRIIA